jgi:hypothetical protein
MDMPVFKFWLAPLALGEWAGTMVKAPEQNWLHSKHHKYAEVSQVLSSVGLLLYGLQICVYHTGIDEHIMYLVGLARNTK